MRVMHVGQLQSLLALKFVEGFHVLRELHNPTLIAVGRV